MKFSEKITAIFRELAKPQENLPITKRRPLPLDTAIGMTAWALESTGFAEARDRANILGQPNVYGI